MQALIEPKPQPLQIGGITPFFIVEDLARSKAFYSDKLGFRATYAQDDFAVLRRDSAQVMIKMIGPGTPPLPNSVRHPWAKWDAYVQVSDPDALWAELAAAGVSQESAVSDTSDGQRGCEVRDPDGYVLFFGRPAGQLGST